MSTSVALHYPSSLSNEHDEIVLGFKKELDRSCAPGATWLPTPISRPMTSTVHRKTPNVPDYLKPVPDESHHTAAAGLPVFNLTANLAFVANNFEADVALKAQELNMDPLSIWSTSFTSKRVINPPIRSTKVSPKFGPLTQSQETTLFVNMAINTCALVLHSQDESSGPTFSEFLANIDAVELSKKSPRFGAEQLLDMELTPLARWMTLSPIPTPTSTRAIYFPLEATLSGVSSISTDSDTSEIYTPGSSVIADDVEIVFAEAGDEEEDFGPFVGGGEEWKTGFDWN